MAAPAGAVPMRGVMKLREMDEKNMHNLFLKNMAGLIEEIKNPSPCTNPLACYSQAKSVPDLEIWFDFWAWKISAATVYQILV